MIPRIVHQVWLGEDAAERPPRLVEASRTWVAHNPGWTHRTWSAAEELVLAPTRPFGISNDLMMARPRHPHFRAALDGLPGSFRRWQRPWVPPYARVILGTGPLYLAAVRRRTAGALAAWGWRP